MKEEAKILLQYGSYKEYVYYMFDKSEVATDMKNVFLEVSNYTVEKNVKSFQEVSRESWTERIYFLSKDIIKKTCRVIIKDFFNNNKFLEKEVSDYIRDELMNKILI